ncbi:hypothetical protein ACQP2E_13795 [Actinoplanes sp. CA-015351]|uniref:hypothetical protein n=1 Tax=Actinoplanes sp. CA-015351 TaxID=3239897 RepID=UPI003D9759D5
MRGARRWRWADEHWRGWLRRSATGVELFTRWQEADEYRYVLGDDAYQMQLIEILTRARPRDCAAAGFGCTRRMDRACSGPSICSRDPLPAAGDDPHREGPVPGGCDSFHGGDDLRVRFSAGDRHKAVQWSMSLWINGVRVGAGLRLASRGWWLDDRFFVVPAEGPDEHPAQEYTMGDLVSVIQSVLIHDAASSTTQVLVPGPAELWTDPWVVRDGDELHVYPDRDTGRAPDRTLTIMGTD